MKVALFEIGQEEARLRYISSPLEINELQTLRIYVADLIAEKRGMAPKDVKL